MGFIQEAGGTLSVLVGMGKRLGTVFSISVGIQRKTPIGMRGWSLEKYPNLLTLNCIISAVRWVFHVGHFISQTAESGFAI